MSPHIAEFANPYFPRFPVPTPNRSRLGNVSFFVAQPFLPVRLPPERMVCTRVLALETLQTNRIGYLTSEGC